MLVVNIGEEYCLRWFKELFEIIVDFHLRGLLVLFVLMAFVVVNGEDDCIYSSEVLRVLLLFAGVMLLEEDHEIRDDLVDYVAETGFGGVCKKGEFLHESNEIDVRFGEFKVEEFLKRSLDLGMRQLLELFRFSCKKGQQRFISLVEGVGISG